MSIAYDQKLSARSVDVDESSKENCQYVKTKLIPDDGENTNIDSAASSLISCDEEKIQYSLKESILENDDNFSEQTFIADVKKINNISSLDCDHFDKEQSLIVDVSGTKNVVLEKSAIEVIETHPLSVDITNCTESNSAKIKEIECMTTQILEDKLHDKKNEDESNVRALKTDINAINILSKSDALHVKIIDSDEVHLAPNTKLSKNFSSTHSLNEEILNSDVNNGNVHSKCSKSIENVSDTNGGVVKEIDSCANEIEFNLDNILTQYSSQKIKVCATNKISDSTSLNSSVCDTKYPKLQKELLPQDFGSIVKNVHGIFSSVSGSLKSAYSQKVQKPQKIINPFNNNNNTLMRDIFEDEKEKRDSNLTNISTSMGHMETSVNSVYSISDRDVALCGEKSGSEVEIKNDSDVVHVHQLERMLMEQKKDNTLLRDKVEQQTNEIYQKDQAYKELESKMDLMSKRVEQAEREKDAAVMRYASVECAGIEARRAAERAVVSEKAALAEVELLNTKLKSAHSEKQRICQLYDNKCHELMVSEREAFKLKEEVAEVCGRLKWTQNKLRTEMEAYKESYERAEKLSQRVAELEAAKEVAAANAADALRAKQLESELKEVQASMILCRHEKVDLDKRLARATQQLEKCTCERDATIASLARTSAEVERLKVSNAQLEAEAAELASLRAQAAVADTLAAELERERERAEHNERNASEMRARAEGCERREAAALRHAEELTAQHVHVQNHRHELETKAHALSVDNASLRERIATLEGEVSRLQSELSEESERRARENKMLARKVAELTEELSEAKQQLEWEKGENHVLKKKHGSAVKELNRELQRALKRCEQLEAKLAQREDSSTTTRTGSVSSLSSAEGAQHDESTRNGHAHAQEHNTTVPDIQIREPDRQTLIERIVSLQRALARRAERCDFLEEHSKQLTTELRSKSRLLRNLLCTMPAGAVTSQDSDRHKKELARLGGSAMGAVWGGDSGALTLELSLEMNARLQAVLEDALLKNITLKENIDTLGEEIARIKQQNKSDSKQNSN